MRRSTDTIFLLSQKIRASSLAYSGEVTMSALESGAKN